MNVLELRTKIDSAAFGPDARAGLLPLTAHASPVVVIVGAYDVLSTADDLTDNEVDLLRECCIAIIEGQWHGKASEAATVLADLPEAPSDDLDGEA